jgi:catechol 2,3-dioxygenase-like lactoylglutathione lyase family enzyme
MTSYIRRFDHVGITVTDLDASIAFFEALGLEVEGRTGIEGDFLDTVIGMAGAKTEIAMMRAPDSDTTVELSSFVRPDAVSGKGDIQVNEVGIRSVAFEVQDIRGAVERAAALGHGLVGGIGEYEGAWRMAYVRGPDGIIVALAERMG